MPPIAVAEDADGWTLRFAEPLVTQLRIDHRFTLLLAGGASVAIGEPFELRRDSRTALVPPGDLVHEVADALPLLNDRVASIRLEASGELRTDFESGASLTVPVNSHFENWEISSPAGELWVGLPGGGVGFSPSTTGQVRHGRTIRPLTGDEG